MFVGTETTLSVELEVATWFLTICLRHRSIAPLKRHIVVEVVCKGFDVFQLRFCIYVRGIYILELTVAFVDDPPATYTLACTSCITYELCYVAEAVVVVECVEVLELVVVGPGGRLT